MSLKVLFFAENPFKDIITGEKYTDTMVSVRVILKALKRAGFVMVRRSPHGDYYVHPDGRGTTVSRHYEDIYGPLLRDIEKQTGLTFD